MQTLVFLKRTYAYLRFDVSILLTLIEKRCERFEDEDWKWLNNTKQLCGFPLSYLGKKRHGNQNMTRT